MPARPSAHCAALRSVFGPVAPTSSRGPPRWAGGGPTGNTESVIFSPAQMRFMTATRSAMSRNVWVFGSALTAR